MGWNINVNFDFTSDSPQYWDGFWERNDGLGCGRVDPDSRSRTLREYSRILWSKTLPNGEKMILEDGLSKFYLRWKDFYFSNDSITASFRHYDNRVLLAKVGERVGDYHSFVENYLRKLYTIGGEIIFPSGKMGINQSRGFNSYIKDRWDLTLECIRRFYAKEWSPLEKVLSRNVDFFQLFVDFKGYVDFFFLQDCVDSNYNVVLWLDTPLFVLKPTPKNVDDYLMFIEKELDFVNRRNNRINQYVQSCL